MEVSGQLHAPGLFSLEERTADTYRILFLVDPRVSLDVMIRYWVNKLQNFIKIPSVADIT